MLPNPSDTVIDYHPIHWSPSLRLGIVWNFVGAGLTVIGVFGFGAISYAAGVDPFHPIGGGSPHFSTLITLGILAVMLALHELCHGAVMRRFGATPRYGASIVAKVLPVFYCSAAGHVFTREQYALAAMAPVVVISALGAALVSVSPFGAWLVVPLGLHFGGAVGDLWATGLMLKQPKGTLIEDTTTGVIMHHPVASAAVLA